MVGGTDGNGLWTVGATGIAWTERDPSLLPMENAMDEFQTSSASETDARAARVLPTQGSENASDILVRPNLPADSAEKDYLPDPAVDWIVDIEFPSAAILQKKRILQVFDQSWFQEYEFPEIYGSSPDDNSWTYVRAGGVPERYTRVCFGAKLFDNLEAESGARSEQHLVALLEGIKKGGKKLGAEAIRERTSPRDGARRA